jgi:translocation and assembly module TamA
VERSSFGIPLGLSQSECNAPPFDSATPRIELWSWPWTDWPVLNPAVLEVDRQRIERWYRARGFYDARVVQIRHEPPEAGALEPEVPAGHCDPQREECTVEITVVIDEGAPLLVGELAIEGLDALPEDARAVVDAAELPQPGERFDELDYDRGKQSLLEQLAEASYAGATVSGEVRLDHARKRARVAYRVTTGAPYRFGEVRVEGNAALPDGPIRAAAAIEPNQPYRQSALREVQQEVYAMGAFSAVEVERELDPSARLVHLRVKVTPLPYDAFRLGVGVTSGALQRTASGQVEPVPQWDVHLLGRYERRHVFGTLGRLRIEDRPRRIFQDDFPKLTDPAWGNVLRVRLNQPGLVEARTDLIFEGHWDYGPDPFLRFTRHDLIQRVAGQRAFLRRLLFGTLALQHDRFIVPDDQRTSTGAAAPDSYLFTFVEQDVRLDLRDDDVQPRSGAYLGLLASQSVRTPASDWTAYRLLPEVRGYVPLPLHMVLAARFAVGFLFITDANPDLDPTSQELGPTTYRLRGGGAQSNRGFAAGELGAGLEGGLRRWESALELRIRLGESFGVVGFFDMGNVTRDPQLACEDDPESESEKRGLFCGAYPSAGFGLRYLTVVGAIRFDVGFRLGDVEVEEDDDNLLLFNSPGAMHLTIGEAF